MRKDKNVHLSGVGALPLVVSTCGPRIFHFFNLFALLIIPHQPLNFPRKKARSKNCAEFVLFPGTFRLHRDYRETHRNAILDKPGVIYPRLDARNEGVESIERTLSAVPVAGNVHPDANSVETVQPSGSGSERSDTITTRRAVRRSRLSKKILSSAVSVVIDVCRGISTVRNVLISERNCRIGNVGGRLTEKPKACRSNVTLLCSEKRRSWPQKPRKDLANLAKGYHR